MKKAVAFPNACAGAAIVVSGQGLDSCLAVHAEQNAILQCRDAQQIVRAYVTAFPCPSCAKILLNTSCQEIVYLEAYGDDAGMKMWHAAGRQAWMFNGEPPMIQRDIVRLFGDDPLNRWRVIVACVCLNLASARQARGIIFRVLERWPHPVDMALANPDLEVMLRPLGLSARRARNLRALSQQWGQNGEMKDLPGVGPYALDSVAVFCEGKLPSEVGDRKVAAWVEWRRRKQIEEDSIS